MLSRDGNKYSGKSDLGIIYLFVASEALSSPEIIAPIIICRMMDLMKNWVDIEVEMVSVAMCNLCGEDCESVDHFLWNCPAYSHFLEHLKKRI